MKSKIALIALVIAALSISSSSEAAREGLRTVKTANKQIYNGQFQVPIKKIKNKKAEVALDNHAEKRSNSGRLIKPSKKLDCVVCKSYNHRNHNEIIEPANKIQKDDLSQTSEDTNQNTASSQLNQEDNDSNATNNSSNNVLSNNLPSSSENVSKNINEDVNGSAPVQPVANNKFSRIRKQVDVNNIIADPAIKRHRWHGVLRSDEK